jgi:ABC-type Zn uptake system ZnuABC Zn-binding protein ZnuA
MTSTELQKLADSLNELSEKARQKVADCGDQERNKVFAYSDLMNYFSTAFYNLSNASELLGSMEAKGETL